MRGKPRDREHFSADCRVADAPRNDKFRRLPRMPSGST
jgi:hypothetical protein